MMNQSALSVSRNSHYAAIHIRQDLNPFGKPSHILDLFRKGSLRLHLFPGTKKALFLGKDNKLYMACLEADAGTGQNQTKLNEIFYSQRAWRLAGTRKHDAAAVTVTGTEKEAAEGKGVRMWVSQQIFAIAYSCQIGVRHFERCFCRFLQL